MLKVQTSTGFIFFNHPLKNHYIYVNKSSQYHILDVVVKLLEEAASYLICPQTPHAGENRTREREEYERDSWKIFC